MTITIKPSPTADTRTCDVSQVSQDQLLDSSASHIDDVFRGMSYLSYLVRQRGCAHDDDKMSGIEQFHADFLTGFKQQGWLKNHYKVNRHHLDGGKGVPADVNLIDVLEHIVDCVMAGMARSGEVRPIELSSELLQDAVENTMKLLREHVQIEGGNDGNG